MPDRNVSGFFLSEDEFRAQAVYSDETKQFRSPVEPLSTDEVEIKIRVGKGTFSAVFLCTDKRECSIKGFIRSFLVFQRLLP